MFGRSKLLLLIPAIILIIAFLGMIPLNLVYKLSNASAFDYGHNAKKCGTCLYNSLVSYDNLALIDMNSTLLPQDLMLSFHITPNGSGLFLTNVSLLSEPLRC